MPDKSGTMHHIHFGKHRQREHGLSLTSGQRRKRLVGNGLGAVVFAVILSGCGSSPSSPVQVVDRTHGGGQARPQATGGQYIVQPGDTLYSIAFRFGWDWKALAARNGIAAPYTIRPGQIIRFDPQGSAQAPLGADLRGLVADRLADRLAGTAVNPLAAVTAIDAAAPPPPPVRASARRPAPAGHLN